MEKSPIRNVHTRDLNAPLERVQPWIEAAWSGGPRDAFPRDVIPNWRRNPDGVDPRALIPGTTLFGHGPFTFRLRSWDGLSWRVDVVGMTGWHGFDLVPTPTGCSITHTLELASGRMRWAVIAPIHDWAVEAIFDRIEHALETGEVPAQTTRPMSWRASAGLALARRLGRRRSRTGDAKPRVADASARA